VGADTARALATAAQHRIYWGGQRPQLFLPRPEIDQVMVRAGNVSATRNPPRQKYEEDSGSQSRFNLR
jgi:hypothetical protein